MDRLKSSVNRLRNVESRLRDRSSILLHMKNSCRVWNSRLNRDSSLLMSNSSR